MVNHTQLNNTQKQPVDDIEEKREIEFYSYTCMINGCPTPNFYYYCEETNSAVIEWIDRVQVKEIKGREIEEIINFIEKINKKGINSNTKLGNATEGNLDIDGWIDVMAKKKTLPKNNIETREV